MQDADTILGLIRERGERGLPLERVYRLLFNRNLYLRAYGKIYRNTGAMTHGVTDETPHGMPVWSDKLLQEVIRLILEAYFEPRFSDHSHGFRPERGCHTALREIYYNWHGTTWFIEGDISQCFDKLSHELLLKELSEHIHDGRFINFIQKWLDAGSMEDWTLNK